MSRAGRPAELSCPRGTSPVLAFPKSGGGGPSGRVPSAAVLKRSRGRRGGTERCSWVSSNSLLRTAHRRWKSGQGKRQNEMR